MDAPDSRFGTVTPDDDGGARMEFRRTWPHGPDEVWAALTDPERTQRWIGRYEGERSAGATGGFAMTEEGDGPPQPVTIEECRECSRHSTIVTASAGPSPSKVMANCPVAPAARSPS